MWSITLNASEVMNGSFQPNRKGTMIRCPEDEIGKNSVSPWTSPMINACRTVSISKASPLAAQALRCRVRALAHAPWGALALVLLGALAWTRHTRRFSVRVRLLPDEERGKHQGDRGQQLDQDVQRRASRVLEGVTDRVADDGGCVSV